MRLAVCVIISLSLLGCGAVRLSEDGSSVIALGEADKPNCKYISRVASSGGDYYNSYDGNFEAGFNAAMNAVAEVGGDAYEIVRSNATGQIYELDAWRCGWGSGKSAANYQRASQLQEISASHRGKCNFIKSIAEGSNWGITESRNYGSAKEDALNLVREIGGDSYYIVNVLQNQYGVGFIIEAWRCN